MPPKQDRLVKARDAIHLKVKRIRDFCENIIETVRDNDVFDLKVRLEYLENEQKSYNAIQQELEIGSEYEDIDRAKFDDEYLSVKSLLYGLIDAATPKDLRENKLQGDVKIKRRHIELPQIKLPLFNGNEKGQWLPFYDAFNSLINENENLSNVQKFHYLRSSLSAPAIHIIDSLDVTSQNYIIAWELLRKRFDNRNLMIKDYISNLFSLPVVESESSVVLRSLIDNVNKNLRLLTTLEQPVEHWDSIIIHLIETKLDSLTRREWETESNKTATASTLKELLQFVENKCIVLESLPPGGSAAKSSTPSKNNKNNKSRSSKKTSLVVNTQSKSCELCKQGHSIYECQQFLNLSIENRFAEVKKLNLCLNCLKGSHNVRRCWSRSCSTCGGRHNTLLHNDNNITSTPNNAKNIMTSQPTKEANDENSKLSKIAALQSISNLNENSCLNIDSDNNLLRSANNTIISNNNPCVCTAITHRHIFLSTVLINVLDSKGNSVTCRAVLDSASMANFVTESFCHRLGVRKFPMSSPIQGINGQSSEVAMGTNLVIESRHSELRLSLEFLILPKITNNLPSFKVDISKWKIPRTLSLADPFFNIPSKIDMLIGGEVFYNLLNVGQIKLNENLPMIQNTKLGWVIGGSHVFKSSMPVLSHISITSLLTTEALNEMLHSQISRFWKIEDLPDTKDSMLSFQEEWCENHFQNTTHRDQNNRFVISLPFNDKKSYLGQSRSIALRRFLTIERKLKRDSKLHEDYSNFMTEYLRLEHMKQFVDEDYSRFNVYLPHHCVVKESSTSTKVRVVFDASAKTDSGVSLNECLNIGPRIQDELFDILLRFRIHNVVIVGDIHKMYRQINVKESDQNYQCILWRNSDSDPIQDFKLQTVTYGTASAPYQACKCLQTLAIVDRDLYPEASIVLLNDFYIDDVITGAVNVKSAIHLRNDLQLLLSRGQFQLTKWISNSPEVLRSIPESLRELQSSFDVTDIETESVGILGMTYNPPCDQFQFKVGAFSKITTKRTMLSDISKLFDPMGLLSPIIIIAKILMQELWKCKLEWDDFVPQHIVTKWEEYQVNVSHIPDITIPRQVTLRPSYTEINLHGFCDSSERAYGAAVYIQTKDTYGTFHCNLICSKSRVAPIKFTTIARLELCGASLLAHLIKKVKSALKIEFDNTYAWTDSLIVTYWLKGDISKWKVYVAHRVTEIRKLVPQEYWHHVYGQQNPADLLSRGETSTRLKNCSLWWHGPDWLSSRHPYHEENLTSTHFLEEPTIQAERKATIVCAHSSVEVDVIPLLLSRFSKIMKIQRILAYVLRFAINSHGPLSIEEIQNSLNRLIRFEQSKYFQTELHQLQKGQSIQGSSSLKSLAPFIDEDCIIRVGGRLSHSDLPYRSKHQVVLPKDSLLTKLIFESEHLRLGHPGPQNLLANIRHTYWPVCGRVLARKITQACIPCFKNNPRKMQQLMGSYPKERLESNRPFLHCGIDFGGPVSTLTYQGRGSRTMKSYFCLFICFSTKAVHVEVVGDLNTQSFLACLARFIGRRGVPSSISSDNATNFVGANAELQRIQTFLRDSNDNVVTELAKQSIKWNFIPANSPHFGGLWESGIKSIKHHMRRIMGNTNYTFEQLTTLFAQIEACLNSRPMYAMSEDPNDLQPLTPGHFIIGEPLTKLPEPSLLHINIGRLSKWQLVQRQLQEIWSRWSTEYIPCLQQRIKWRTSANNLKPNNLVLIVDDNRPPLQWCLGRVVEVHSGSDGHVRVATVRTSTGIYRRAIAKLCLLPNQDNMDEI